MSNKIKNSGFAWIFLLLTVSACGGQPAVATILPTGAVAAAQADVIVESGETPTALPAELPATAMPTLSAPVLAGAGSPFEGYSYTALLESVSNPYTAPPPGSDDPHEGVDLAVMDAQRIAYSGENVRAVLPGRVAGVIYDRFPYGNALLIETASENLLPEIVRGYALPIKTAPPPFYAPMYCPEGSLRFVQDASGGQALYLVYAHLLNQPAQAVGDEIESSEIIGQVGGTGNAINPHLHLEVRAGPPGQTFSSMAHYENSATAEEMGAYCFWRISGTFQLLDPLKLLQWIPAE